MSVSTVPTWKWGLNDLPRPEWLPPEEFIRARRAETEQWSDAWIVTFDLERVWPGRMQILARLQVRIDPRKLRTRDAVILYVMNELQAFGCRVHEDCRAYPELGRACLESRQ